MSQHVVPPGATGFIAKRILLVLLNKGYCVTASLRSMMRADKVHDVVRPRPTGSGALDTHLQFAELDLTKDDGWDAATKVCVTNVTYDSVLGL